MIAFDALRVTDMRELAAIVDAARISTPPQFPAILAGASGTIDVTFLRSRTLAPPSHLTDFSRPHLVILGDDPPQGFGEAVGPSPWRCAARLQYLRPAFCFVHASGGAAADYAAMVAATREQGRVLLVETGSAHGPAWGHLMKRYCPTVVWLPTDGQHPVLEAMH